MSSLCTAVHRDCAGATDGESCPWGGGRADALLVNLRPLDCLWSAQACTPERNGMVHLALLQDGVVLSRIRAASALIEMLISRIQCCKLGQRGCSAG